MLQAVVASAGHQPPDTDLQIRRADHNERFVAFAFAGADMVVETDAGGVVTYAAGAFRSKFGCPPEAFVGRAVRDLVAPADHAALGAALGLLMERGRLLPMMIRLSDTERTNLALAGMAIPTPGRPLRLCLSLARPPAPLASVRHAGSPHHMARATEAKLRAGIACDLGLLEIVGAGGVVVSRGEAIGQALEALAPHALASEIAPGRFGLLGSGGSEADLLTVAALLEAALRNQGVEVTVTSRHIGLATGELTPTQAARALRQALNVFARDGVKGLNGAGFDDGLAEYMRRAGAQTARLRHAIRVNQFSLQFQPIVSFSGRATHHFEALIRPKGAPDYPSSAPQDFVMLVEALGLADELDMAVARLACDAAHRAGAAVAFNLSGQSVQGAEFRDRLTGLLKASPACKAGLVTVEMTETAEIEDVRQAALTATALRALGVPFCLDDFGAGAADIRLLRALNPDTVKLDGSYTPGVTQEGRKRALFAGMVEMARAAGAKIVAERVETEAEANALRELGVHYGQGWLFGRPGPLPARGVVPVNA